MNKVPDEVFWADQLADAIINRKKYNYIDKEIKYPEKLIVKSSTSISGVPHIGNASDVIRHDAAVRALIDKGRKAEFIWVAEDMDALRKVPAGIPAKFKEYLGMPVADIPCPDNCCGNYSEHFSKLFINSLTENFGTNPKYLSTATTYRNGDFYKWIKMVMNKLPQVKQIWEQSTHNELKEGWNPWQPVCEKCGKIMTTVVKGIDGDMVSYKCEDYQFKKFGQKAYTGLHGCGHEGVSDIRKGNGKLLWRVEWGMLWAEWKVILEGAGKEHFMPTGSFWTAGRMAEEVFDWMEPYPGDNPLQPYEYLTIDGAKMSASVGNTVATWEWPEFALPQILRLLFLKRLRKVRDFSYRRLPDYVDEYDKMQKIYFGVEKASNEREEKQLKRLYEMIETVEIPKKLPIQIPFSFAAMISQIFNPEESMESAIRLLKSTGHIKGDVSKEDWDRIQYRLGISKNWVERFATEDMRITVHDEPVKVDVDVNMRKALDGLIDVLGKGEKDLQHNIYELAKSNDVLPKDFFKMLYNAILDKDMGPRLGPFIAAIGEDRVKNILSKV